MVGERLQLRITAVPITRKTVRENERFASTKFFDGNVKSIRFDKMVWAHLTPCIFKRIGSKLAQSA
jgi:hypothetical protein